MFPRITNIFTILKTAVVLNILLMGIGELFLSQYWDKKCLPDSGKEIVNIFWHERIAPDVIPKSPARGLNVTFMENVDVCLGNVLHTNQVRSKPTWVEWDGNSDKYYVLMMIDADAPSHERPYMRSWWLWGVVNIQGSEISTGEVLTDYRGVAPGMDYGDHRYVFLVYEQRHKMLFAEPKIDSFSMFMRPAFSPAAFAEAYKLGDPVFGNYFVCSYTNHKWRASSSYTDNAD